MPVDAKDYEGNLNTIGNMILVLMGLFFFGGIMFALLLAMTSTSMNKTPEQFVLETCLAAVVGFGALFVMLFYQGYLLRIPMKVFEDRIEIQPRFGLKPISIPFAEIKSIKFGISSREWWPRGACSIYSTNGYEYSHEHFKSKEALRQFITAIKPILDKYGFGQTKEKEGRKYLSITFQR